MTAVSHDLPIFPNGINILLAISAKLVSDYYRVNFSAPSATVTVATVTDLSVCSVAIVAGVTVMVVGSPLSLSE